MKATTVRHRMKAPPQRVWEALVDLEHAAERIRGVTRIEVLTPGPFGKGTRWKESRLVMKREQTAEFEAVEVDPPNSYTARSESVGLEMLFTLSVHPDVDERGSIVEMTFSTKGLTALAKVMSVLMGWMMASMCRKEFVKDMEDIERSLASAIPAGE